MSETAEMKLIAATVYDPGRPSLFGKGKKNERAEFRQIHCSCESCPLRANRQCVQIAFMGRRCPYGTFHTESGPTQRARGYYSWTSEREKIAREHGWLSVAAHKMAFIGDYVFLPYSHMNMNKDIPFVYGTFLKREDWTIENVLTLIDFKPQALFGGTISSYRTEQIPLFISHIRECDKDMWAKLIAVRPALNTEPSYVGRKALLRTLAYPITISPYDNRYPVSWSWDGEKATTIDVDGYYAIWGKIPAKAIALSIVPTENATVVVKDNAWVTPETVFVD